MPTAAAKEDMCGWHGQTGALPRPEGGEATLLLPVCPGCFAQHKKARRNGKRVTFIWGGRRAATTAAANQRVDDFRSAQAKAAAAGPAAGRAAAAAIAGATKDIPAGGAAGGGGEVWPAGLLAETKEGEVALRENKEGAPARAMAGAKAGGKVAAVRATL